MNKEVENGEISSKFLIKALFIISFFVLVVWGVGRKAEQTDKIENIKTEKVIQRATSQEEGEGVLSEVPLNEKINIARAGKKKTADGELLEQSIVFYSKDSVSENKIFYDSWAKENSWQKTGSFNNEDNSISLMKESAALDVSFEEEQSGSVKITLVYRVI